MSNQYKPPPKIQPLNIKELIEKIKNNEVFDDKLYLKNIYNENKRYSIEWCKHYNINIKNDIK